MKKKEGVKEESQPKNNQEEGEREESTLIILSPFGIAIVPMGIVRSESIDDARNRCNCPNCRFRREHTGHA